MRFKKLKELDKFIKENSGRLNPEIKNTFLNYCHSCLAFENKKYENALNFLSKINFDHYQLKFLIKNLTLKIYYEQKQYEAIFSLIDSLQTHCHKRKVNS
ncbi:MAG: hypothetical protein M3R36_17225 [Bacteroidota bacterium]|nr:hypothetical protein [Bacteroidota bacterium]